LKLSANDSLQRAWLERGGGGNGTGDAPPSDAPPRHLGVFARLAAGSLAGGLAQAAVYPLEVVQTRLAASAAGTYAGAIHCARLVWAKEGPAAFGRGLVPTLVGLVPYAGVDIAAFELLKEALTPESLDGSPVPAPAAALLAAGVASSTAAQVAAYPLGFVRVRLQMDGLGGAPRR
jgi:solute carrier family 25 phosphate transporter 23/24/25/41